MQDLGIDWDGDVAPVLRSIFDPKVQADAAVLEASLVRPPEAAQVAGFIEEWDNRLAGRSVAATGAKDMPAALAALGKEVVAAYGKVRLGVLRGQAPAQEDLDEVGRRMREALHRGLADRLRQFQEEEGEGSKG